MGWDEEKRSAKNVAGSNVGVGGERKEVRVDVGGTEVEEWRWTVEGQVKRSNFCKAPGGWIHDHVAVRLKPSSSLLLRVRTKPLEIPAFYKWSLYTVLKNTKFSMFQKMKKKLNLSKKYFYWYHNLYYKNLFG